MEFSNNPNQNKLYEGFDYDAANKAWKEGQEGLKITSYDGIADSSLFTESDMDLAQSLGGGRYQSGIDSGVQYKGSGTVYEAGASGYEVAGILINLHQ